MICKHCGNRVMELDEVWHHVFDNKICDDNTNKLSYRGDLNVWGTFELIRIFDVETIDAYSRVCRYAEYCDDPRPVVEDDWYENGSMNPIRG